MITPDKVFPYKDLTTSLAHLICVLNQVSHCTDVLCIFENNWQTFEIYFLYSCAQVLFFAIFKTSFWWDVNLQLALPYFVLKYSFFRERCYTRYIRTSQKYSTFNILYYQIPIKFNGISIFHKILLKNIAVSYYMHWHMSTVVRDEWPLVYTSQLTVLFCLQTNQTTGGPKFLRFCCPGF